MENNAFVVGLTLSIEAPQKIYLQTQLLGWEKDVFLVTKAAYVQGQPAKLGTKDICKVRFLHEGTAYGFETTVIAVQFFPFPVMYLKYPGNIEFLKLRVAPRLRTNLPIVFRNSNGSKILNGVMVDISDGGCGLNMALADGKDLKLEDGYMLEFKLMDKTLNLGCTIKKLDAGKDPCFLGTEFSGLTAQAKESLVMYLDFLKKHAPAG